MTPFRYAVDTNILLQLSNEEYAQHELAVVTLRRLVSQQVELCFTQQNLGEFWNVCTRPGDQNGLGLSIADADTYMVSIEKRMTILQEDHRVYPAWRRLLIDCEVRGKQVHDAHLAAVLAVHGVRHLLTFNGKDFKRFQGLIAVHPEDVRP